MPKIVGKSTTVVEFEGLRIDELAGNVASKDDTISIAKVIVSRPTSEPWLTLEYDEWICVLTGHLELHYGADEKQVLTVKVGETAFVQKGERFRPIFPVPTEYIPVCLPAFKPERCHREEEGNGGAPSEVSRKLQQLHSDSDSDKADVATRFLRDAPDVIYHMCEKSAWERSLAAKEAYFPPTYAKDGFTHATAVPARLLDTANHFYTASQDEWVCLELSSKALYKLGILTTLEGPKPVGEQDVDDEWKTSDWRCPHIFGGIPGHMSGIVTNVYPMTRSDGKFLSISGLTE
jgi:mannose-6-phosphate isomerase-like protein (cupin superfamily)